MKKILIIIGLFLAAVGFLWYLQNKLSSSLSFNSGESMNNNMATTTAIITVKELSINAVKPVVTPVLSLAEEALKVARAPFHPSSAASSEVVALANKKIGELVASIVKNYDSEAQWLDLGSYRKLVGDNSGAIAAWNFLAKIRPQDYIAQHNLGDLYAFSLRDYVRGERYFLKSIELNQANVQGYLALANLYAVASFGKTGQVASILLRGIEANPGELSLITALASYYRDAGNIDKAIEYFKMALHLAPQNNAISDELAKLEYKRDGVK